VLRINDIALIAVVLMLPSYMRKLHIKSSPSRVICGCWLESSESCHFSHSAQVESQKIATQVRVKDSDRYNTAWFRSSLVLNLVSRACDPREGMWGSGIIRCRKPGILAKIELHIPFQRPIRFLPETDYPRASRSFSRIAGSGNEIALVL
jgi:hypothetical protein